MYKNCIFCNFRWIENIFKAESFEPYDEKPIQWFTKRKWDEASKKIDLRCFDSNWKPNTCCYIIIECLRSCAKMNNHHYDSKLSSTTLLNQTTPDQQSTSQFQNEEMRSSLRRQSLICNSLLLPSDISAPNDTSIDCQNNYNDKRTTNSYASKRYLVYNNIADKNEKSF